MGRYLVVVGLAAVAGCTSEPPESSSIGAGSCANGYSCEALLVGARDVYASGSGTIAAGSVVRVRIIEDVAFADGSRGAAMLGEAPVGSDRSFAALVPASTPVRFQLVDKYRMALVGETGAISGPAGGSRLCGGCHESPPTHPSTTTQEPVDYDRPLAERRSTDYSAEHVVGVPWDLALQPIFDAKCIACHDGDATKPGNRSLTFTDTTTGLSQTFVFDLRGLPYEYPFGGEMIAGYSRSHLSLVGAPLGELAELGIVVTGDLTPSVEPGSARRSRLFEKLNPPQALPTPDPGNRFIPHAVPHPLDVGGRELTPDEYRLLILSVDMGCQFYSRENTRR